jgi:hypothetical protein
MAMGKRNQIFVQFHLIFESVGFNHFLQSLEQHIFESSLIIDGATVKVSHFIMTIKTFVIMKNNVFSNNA